MEELCSAFNTKKSTIYNWLKITECDKVLLGLIHKGFLSVYHGIEIMREPNYSRRLEIINECLLHKWSVRDIKQLIDTNFSPTITLGVFGWFNCYYEGKIVAIGKVEEHCKTCKQHTNFQGIVAKRGGKEKKYKTEEEYIEEHRFCDREGDETSILIDENNEVLTTEIKEFLKEYNNREIKKSFPETKEQVEGMINLLKQTLSREDFSELNFNEDKLREELEVAENKLLNFENETQIKKSKVEDFRK